MASDGSKVMAVSLLIRRVADLCQAACLLPANREWGRCALSSRLLRLADV